MEAGRRNHQALQSGKMYVPSHVCCTAVVTLRQGYIVAPACGNALAAYRCSRPRVLSLRSRTRAAHRYGRRLSEKLKHCFHRCHIQKAGTALRVSRAMQNEYIVQSKRLVGSSLAVPRLPRRSSGVTLHSRCRNPPPPLQPRGC